MIRNHLRMIDHSTQVDPGIQPESGDLAVFQGDLTDIPLANNSLDALVLHHSLETSADPRTALRECARVLSGGGRLVVCAFNPMSLWGLRAVYGRFRTDAFSALRLTSVARLQDWLAVLGFDIEPINYVAYSLPLDRHPSDAAVWRKCRSLMGRSNVPLGGAYVLSAVKMAMAARGANWVTTDRAGHVVFWQLVSAVLASFTDSAIHSFLGIPGKS